MIARLVLFTTRRCTSETHTIGDVLYGRKLVVTRGIIISKPLVPQYAKLKLQPPPPWIKSCAKPLRRSRVAVARHA